MHPQRIQQITEALFNNSASVIKRGILEYVTLEELLDLSLHPDERTAFRAAWALEHVLLADGNKNLLPYYSSILTIYNQSQNWSVLRSISKLLMLILKDQTTLNSIQESDVENILNTTFGILEDQDCPVAVRCNTYDILCEFVYLHPWLAHELRQRMQLDLEKNEMPALKSRAKKVMQRLERIAKT